MATPAPISLSLLATLPNPNLELCNALGTFKYVPTLVITHKDPSFVPSSPSLQRDLHFQRPLMPVKTLQVLHGYAHATHVLHHRSPHLQGLKVYQTTNPHRYPRKGTILSQTWFKRYLPTLESLRTKDEVFGPHGWGQGQNNIWFVGSWCGEGIPLLEGCVESAENVINEIFSGENQKE